MDGMCKIHKVQGWYALPTSCDLIEYCNTMDKFQSR